MSYRRLLSVVFMLALASLACSVNLGNSPSPTSVALAPSKTPASFHNGGVTPGAPTEGAPTEAGPTGAAPTDQPTEPKPTKAPTRAPTKVPTKAPTKAPKPTAQPTEAQASTCPPLAANGDVYWVTFDQNNNATTVTSYPTGVTEINPAFDYDCNPASVTVVSVWSFNGKQIFSDKNTVDPTDTQGTFVDGLKKNDNTAVDDGDYAVQFFNAKQLIGSGKVTVGGGGGTTTGGGPTGGGTGVTVQGTITDKASGKPINGAIFVALKPGISADQFVNKDQGATADEYSRAVADSSGQFTLPDQLLVGQTYSVVAFANNYNVAFEDGFKIDSTTPDPSVFNVQLSK